MNRERLEAKIKREEGLRLKIYKDTRGILTIGYGHNCEGNSISMEAAEHIFQDDLKQALEVAESFLWFHRLNDARQEVLIEMCWIFGPSIRNKWSNTLHYMEVGNWERVCEILEHSVWSGQAPNRVKRILEAARKED